MQLLLRPWTIPPPQEGKGDPSQRVCFSTGTGSTSLNAESSTLVMLTCRSVSLEHPDPPAAEQVSQNLLGGPCWLAGPAEQELSPRKNT